MQFILVMTNFIQINTSNVLGALMLFICARGHLGIKLDKYRQRCNRIEIGKEEGKFQKGLMRGHNAIKAYLP